MQFLEKYVSTISVGWKADPTQIALMVSACIFLVALWLMMAVRSRQVVQRRAASGVGHVDLAGTTDRQSIHFAEEAGIAQLIEKAGRLFSPNSKTELNSIRRQLLQAGFISESAVYVYYLFRIALACGLPLVFLLFYGLLPFELPAFAVVVLVAAIASCAMILPAVMLDWRRSDMRDRYRRAFPDMMDLLVVCVESGNSLHAALERVGREIASTCPELGANMQLMCLELRAGRSLAECLNGLHDRVGIDEVKSLQLLLKQAEELGSSIATTLRVFSEEMREKRMSRAEAKAYALPVKLTIPLGAFIFPVILLVILVPMVIRITNAIL